MAAPLQRRASAKARLRAAWWSAACAATWWSAACAAVALGACGSGSDGSVGTGGSGRDNGGDVAPPAPTPPAPTPPAPPPPPAPPKATVLGAVLDDPWSLAFLPDGRMLVTQRAGSFVIVKADGSAVDAAVTGPLPAVAAAGQGGLLDVALDPDFATNRMVYWTFAEAGTGGTGTAVARGQLNGSALSDVAVIYRQVPKVPGGNHFGSRLVFRGDGTLYVTLGERAQDAPEAPNTQFAQNLTRSLGKVIRITRDGGPAIGNPDLGPGSLPEIWSYGHRNPQGAAVRPGTLELWVTEHGPRGGDELNRVAAGRNYGWPLRSYGCPYAYSESASSCRPGGTGGVHAPQFEEPQAYWLPVSTAPSGLLFYTGDKFPEWQGQVFVGALAGQTLWRLPLDPATLATPQKFAVDAVSALNKRIRYVAQGPDGWIYLLSTDGRLIRLER
jgi:glucose/arabinose dehydrogenase